MIPLVDTVISSALIFIIFIDFLHILFQARNGLVTNLPFPIVPPVCHCWQRPCRLFGKLRQHRVVRKQKSACKLPLTLYEKQLTGAHACNTYNMYNLPKFNRKNFVAKGFKSPKNFFIKNTRKKKSVNDFSRMRNYSQAVSIKYPNFAKKILWRGFKSTFVSKISVNRESCFSQDLCPQMALYRRL